MSKSIKTGLRNKTGQVGQTIFERMFNGQLKMQARHGRPQELARTRRNQDRHPPLMGVDDGASPVGHREKATHRTATWPSSSTPRCVSNRTENKDARRYLHARLHCSSPHNRPMWKQAKCLSADERVSKTQHTQRDSIQPSKEGKSWHTLQRDELWKPYTMRNKPEQKDKYQQDHPRGMWNRRAGGGGEGLWMDRYHLTGTEFLLGMMSKFWHGSVAMDAQYCECPWHHCDVPLKIVRIPNFMF